MKSFLRVLLSLSFFFHLNFSQSFGQKKPSSNSSKEAPTIIDENPILSNDQMGFVCYMQKNLNPDLLRGIKDSVSVVVFFEVDSIGFVRNPRIYKPINEIAEKELIRVVESMPRWTPGKSRGKNVTVMMNFILRLPYNSKRWDCN